MYTKKELDFLEWMEDNHASDMPGVALKSLTSAQKEMAWKLADGNLLDGGLSMESGQEEFTFRASGSWVMNQWSRANQNLPPNAEQIQYCGDGQPNPGNFVIQRFPAPLSSVQILQVIPMPGSSLGYVVKQVPTEAQTVVEAMEQVNGQPFEKRVRMELLKTHPY